MNNKNTPPPLIGETFVFTGKLAFIVRKDAKDEVIKRGGICSDNVTKNTTYVVAGLEDFQHFVNGTKSTKLQKAEKYIADGINMKIINEHEFMDMLK